jgi:hypothetical protein
MDASVGLALLPILSAACPRRSTRDGTGVPARTVLRLAADDEVHRQQDLVRQFARGRLLQVEAFPEPLRDEDKDRQGRDGQVQEPPLALNLQEGIGEGRRGSEG